MQWFWIGLNIKFSSQAHISSKETISCSTSYQKNKIEIFQNKIAPPP